MKSFDRHMPRPTPAELEILRVLWERGPSTVREVHEVLNATRETGNTTVLKFLQIMTEKGLVLRDTSRRPYLFTAQLPREQTQRQLLNDLVDRAFDSSASQLVMRALSGARATPQEIAAMRRMLDELERSEG